MLLRSLFAFALVAAVAACNPKDCQGAGFQTDLPVVDTDDIPAIVPLCEGNATTVNGDVNVINQAQLDTLKGCKKVVGNITIIGSSDIVDLASLETLETIDQGYFLAFNNSGLVTIDLPNLVDVAYGFGVIDNPVVQTVNVPQIVELSGDITIRNNAVLSNVAFPKLQKLLTDARGGAGNLIIAENPAFTGFANFGVLEEIQGFMSVFSNDSLENFEGLEILNKILNTGKAQQALAIGIDFDAENNITAAGNAKLKDLSGLGDLEEIDGDIFIGFNPEMTSMAGLSDLRVHQKSIFIVGNEKMVDLTGLDGDGGNDGEDDGLQVVNGDIVIGLFFDRFKQPVGAGNQSFKNLTGLNNLAQLDGSLVLAFNPQLEDLTGLDVLPAIGKDLVVVGSNMVFDGADALTTINGNLVLGQLFGNDDKVLRQPLDVNEVLQDQNKTDVTLQLDAGGDNTDFPALTTVGKDLIIAFANAESLRIADTLTTVGGRVIVHGSSVDDLTGLETLNSIGGLVVGLAVDKNGDFSASGNNNLSAFTGLNVNVIGNKGFAVGFNDNLDDLGSLAGVNQIQGDVTIVAEDFNTLDGMNVTNIGGDLNIGAIKNSNAAPIDAGLDNLTALNLQELQQIGGDVLIAFNDDLTDVGMPALNNVGGKLEITASASLTTVTGLGALTQVGDLRLHDLVELDTINLPNLNTVNNDLFLVRDNKLVTVNLNNLGNVKNTVELSKLGALVNLNFLASLTNVGDINNQTGDLIVADNEALTDISGLNSLQRVGNDFLLARNPSVDNLELASLGQVGGTFEVTGMNGLEDMQPVATGTQALVVVGDTLRVRGNANLLSLKGLEAVTNIGLALSIVDNPKLETVLIDLGAGDVVDVGDEGLVLLATVGNVNFDEDAPTGDRGVIEVQNNPQLDEDQINDLIQDLDGFEGNGGFIVACGNNNQLLNGSLATCDVDVFGQRGGGGGGEGEGE
jgi:hypothetical protein